MHETMVATVDPAHYNHVRIVLGMVVGLALTHLLRQLARIIERPGYRRLYAIHLGWVAFLFLYLLHFWWWEFYLSDAVQWTFGRYGFVTLYALLLYLLCSLAMPETMEAYASYRQYYYDRRQWFFSLLALVFLVDLIDTGLKGDAYFRALGPEYLIRNGLYVVGAMAALATRRPAYHAVFVLFALCYEITWIVRRYDLL